MKELLARILDTWKGWTMSDEGRGIVIGMLAMSFVLTMFSFTGGFTWYHHIIVSIIVVLAEITGRFTIRYKGENK